MALERRLTAYKYINKSVPDPFQEGILWHDSGSNAVQFECAGDTTPWHGELRRTMFDQMIIRFDSKCRDHRPPILKVVCLFASAPETYQGERLLRPSHQDASNAPMDIRSLRSVTRVEAGCRMDSDESGVDTSFRQLTSQVTTWRFDDL